MSESLLVRSLSVWTGIILNSNSRAVSGLDHDDARTSMADSVDARAMHLPAGLNGEFHGGFHGVISFLSDHPGHPT